ncbi:alkylation response protein AidB-like acyl-CoA dehydrogenase [Streptacidiphilus sp. MAP12-16]|uniref:acyl-CoA dehydrogenase family protein n=1 Tax=Streptacidiphilus sp. MAP12-16 TaxID=3156300 RepID=UPI0035136C58
MDFSFSAEDDAFRARARSWLAERLAGGGSFADLRAATPSSAAPDRRRAWERELGAGGWIGLGWTDADDPEPAPSLSRQVVWAEEYARAAGPAPLGIVGEHLLAPTLLRHGTAAQRERFLSPIARGQEIWCQGYSEPGAGSDLAAVRTTATPSEDGGSWLVTGQKTWTSLSQWADWCFVLARTERGSQRHHGLSLLLLPMDQPGRIDVRPIRQLDGASEFSEVFFDGARAQAGHVLGRPGDGWRVAMDLLSFERGAGMLGRQIGYARELDTVLAAATASGTVDDPVIRERLTRQWAELHVMRCNALRTLGTAEPGSAAVAKLVWGDWHQRLGELAVQVLGPTGALAPGAHDPGGYPLTAAQHLLLFSRADTVYGGSDQIQRNLIAERVLGLPREPCPQLRPEPRPELRPEPRPELRPEP